MKQQYLKKIYRKESQLSWDAKDLGRSHSELILSLASQKRGGTPLLQKKKIVLFQDMEVSSGFSDAGTHAFASNESSLSANLDFSQWYAQAGDAVFFDVSSHVSTPYSGDASDSKDFLVHGDQNSVGLSNLAIALLGLAGIGGVVALASSKGSSSSTPDTTAPTVQSLNANATAGTVTLSFSESLDPLHLPLASAFDIRTGVALASNPVSSIEVSGNSLILHLSNSCKTSHRIPCILRYSYDRPTHHMRDTHKNTPDKPLYHISGNSCCSCCSNPCRNIHSSSSHR